MKTHFLSGICIGFISGVIVVFLMCKMGPITARDETIAQYEQYMRFNCKEDSQNRPL